MLRAGKIHMEVLWYMSEYALECATWKNRSKLVCLCDLKVFSTSGTFAQWQNNDKGEETKVFKEKSDGQP